MFSKVTEKPTVHSGQLHRKTLPNPYSYISTSSRPPLRLGGDLVKSCVARGCEPVPEGFFLGDFYFWIFFGISVNQMALLPSLVTKVLSCRENLVPSVTPERMPLHAPKLASKFPPPYQFPSEAPGLLRHRASPPGPVLSTLVVSTETGGTDLRVTSTIIISQELHPAGYFLLAVVV